MSGQTYRAGSVILLSLAGMMVTSCCGQSCGDPTPKDQRELERNAAIWSSVGPRTYRFTLQPSYFAPPEVTRAVRIEVRDKVAVSITAADGVSTIDPAYYAPYDTIDKLFTYLRNARDQNPVRFDVTYDVNRRFPTAVTLDYRREIADDEMSISVKDFEEIP